MAQAYVPQTDIQERIEFSLNYRYGIEEYGGLRDRHIQDLVDGFIFVADVKSFPVVTFAMTGVARHVDIGQEMHFHFD